MTGIDFSTAPEWHDIFYKEPTAAAVRRLAGWLRDNRLTFVRLYHGTWEGHPVIEKGLLPTSAGRAKSLQSRHGVVSLSVYPGMAEDFGRMAYPGRNIAVYAVDITVRQLIADRDQLMNQRQWAEREAGDTLAESLAFGHGAQVRGKISNMYISRIK